MTRKPRPKANERVRKIGERTETIAVRLTPIQIEDERAKVIDLLQEKEELEEKLASMKAEYKAKIADVDSRKASALGAIRTGKISREMTIEEWVTGGNEVVRVDKATGEEIGARRTATARELQEELPLPPADAPKAPADAEEDEDDGEAEHDREVAADQAEEGADFGDKA